MLETDLPQERFQEASDNAKQGASSLSPALRAAIFKSLKEHQQRGEAARSLHEPLCIAFGTSFASPTAPTYQIYDLPKTVEVRLYMESTNLQCILNEISEWEQVSGNERSRFLAGLLKDKQAHDDFFVRLPDHDGHRRMRKLRGIIILPAKRVTVAKVHKDDNDHFTLKYQHPCLEHADEETARGSLPRFVYCKRQFSLDELQTYLVPRHWAAIKAALKVQPETMQLPPCPPGAAAPSAAANGSASMRRRVYDSGSIC